MTEADIGELVREVHDLQRRVRNLEQRLGEGAEPVAPLRTREETSPRLPPNLLPVLGRALVAIAGAYVLRALTELGVLAPLVGVAAGIVYALVWLFVAARQTATSFPATLSTVTSAVIMAPLLWEASTRLKVVSSPACAAVLTGYAFLALALGWRRRIVAAIGSAAATLTAAALLLQTHDLYPFTMALLAIGAAQEFEACRGRSSGSRWLTAVAADLAAILVAWIVWREGGLPEGYAAVSAHAALSVQFLLLGVYTSSAVIRTLVQRHCFTALETAQTTVALAIGIGESAALLAGSARGTVALGVIALAGGVTCYVVSFVVAGLQVKWNFRAWASFGMLLVLAGTFLMLPSSGYWVLWCGCAVVCCWTAMAAKRPTLGLHGAGYLLLAALACGAAVQPFSQWFGAGDATSWKAAVVFSSALLAWVTVARSSPGDTARWRNQASSLLLAAAVVWILAGAATRALVLAWPVGGVPADTLGTVVLTLVSVALAWSGRRWERRELVWLVYGFMGLGAWKLVARDVPNEHNLTLVVSLSFYGGTLILLPRMLQRRSGA
jgi:hypothetical protein